MRRRLQWDEQAWSAIVQRQMEEKYRKYMESRTATTPCGPRNRG